MIVHFYKYQGAGNDFILVDNRNNSIDHHHPELIARLCDRRFGIGGDGMMFLQNLEGYDFEMVYYNADGQPSSMCGNGGRCIVAFAKHLGIIDTETNFLAVDGPHYAKISAGTYRKEGININFVEPTANGYFVRTFERGVEDETYACGTGVTAVALAMAKQNNQTGHITTPIKVLGGDLNIRFDYNGEKFSSIFLEGPAVKVFEGEISLEKQA